MFNLCLQDYVSGNLTIYGQGEAAKGIQPK